MSARVSPREIREKSYLTGPESSTNMYSIYAMYATSFCNTSGGAVRACTREEDNQTKEANKKKKRNVVVAGEEDMGAGAV